MSEPTPGPWQAQEDLDVLAFKPDGTVLCVVATAWGLTVDEAVANARLIAAAPDLLRAARDAWALIEREFPPGHARAGPVQEALLSAGSRACWGDESRGAL